MIDGLEPTMASTSDILAAKAALEAIARRVGGRPGVSGVGLGRDADGGYSVQVLLTHMGAGGSIPAQWRGVRVATQIIGRLRAS